MRKKLLRKSLTMLAVSFCMMMVHQAHAQFTKGNLVILRIGNDTGAVLTSSSTACFLDQITTAGALVNSFAIPTTGKKRLTMSGSATSEGQITLTPDGKRIIVAGYDTLVGRASVSSSAATSIPRVINEITSGAVMTRAASSDSFQTNNSMRSAASNGTDYWGAGGGSGTTYYGTGTPAVLQDTTSNTRVINVYNGSLYYSTGSINASGVGIYKVGTGLPKTTGQTITAIALTGVGSSPYAFVFNSTGSVLYVADDRTGTGGGVQKYTKSGGVYTLAYTLSVGTARGARGVCVDFSGASPVLYATTTDNKVVKITDAGAGSAATVIYTALKNMALRGVQFAPASGCTATKPTISASGATTNVCPNKTVTLTSSAATSYLWSTGATTQSIVVKAAGSYSVTITDAAGCTATSDATVVTYQGCAKPTGLVASNLTATTAKLTWTAVPCAVGYRYEWRKKGTTPWNHSQGTAVTKTITGLTASTTYQWRVIAACRITPDTLASGYTNGPEFTTPAAFAGAAGYDDLAAANSKTLAAMLYPNPAGSNTAVTISNASGLVQVTVTDLSGRQLFQSKTNQNKVNINVSDFAKGTYLVVVKDDNATTTLKLNKQ